MNEYLSHQIYTYLKIITNLEITDDGLSPLIVPTVVEAWNSDMDGCVDTHHLLSVCDWVGDHFARG